MGRGGKRKNGGIRGGGNKGDISSGIHCRGSKVPAYIAVRRATVSVGNES